MVAVNITSFCWLQSPDIRQAQLEQRRERYLQHWEVNPDVPLFEQASVHTKMINFHFKLASLEFHTCTSCWEHFASLAMVACSTESSRCNRDTRIPKLYSQHGPRINPSTITGNWEWGVHYLKYLHYRVFSLCLLSCQSCLSTITRTILIHRPHH